MLGHGANHEQKIADNSINDINDDENGLLEPNVERMGCWSQMLRDLH